MIFSSMKHLTISPIIDIKQNQTQLYVLFYISMLCWYFSHVGKEIRINYPKVKVDAIEGRQCLPSNERNLNTSFHITYES